LASQNEAVGRNFPFLATGVSLAQTRGVHGLFR